MELDEWEALASRMQDELAASANEEIQAQPMAQAGYEPKPMRKADEGLSKQSQRSAVDEYLVAQRKAREQRLSIST